MHQSNRNPIIILNVMSVQVEGQMCRHFPTVFCVPIATDQLMFAFEFDLRSSAISGSPHAPLCPPQAMWCIELKALWRFFSQDKKFNKNKHISISIQNTRPSNLATIRLQCNEAWIPFPFFFASATFALYIQQQLWPTQGQVHTK